MRDAFLSLLNNQWIIGIGAGLISSFIIAVFSLIVVKVRKQAKYKKAHENCVEILTKYIEKNGIPSETIILSIINVVSDALKIDPNKLSTKTIANALLLHLIQQQKFSAMKTKKFLTDIEQTISSVNIMRVDTTEILRDEEFLIDIMKFVLVLDTPFENKTHRILFSICYVSIVIIATIISEVMSFTTSVVFIVIVNVIFIAVLIFMILRRLE